VADSLYAKVDHPICCTSSLARCWMQRNSAIQMLRCGSWLNLCWVAAYLPPYSPNLNPIEKAWSKFKQLLRAAEARTEQALEQAITEALQQISAENAQAWFRLTLNWVQL